jgi:hypothetical protein
VFRRRADGASLYDAFNCGGVLLQVSRLALFGAQQIEAVVCLGSKQSTSNIRTIGSATTGGFYEKEQLQQQQQRTATDHTS